MILFKIDPQRFPIVPFERDAPGPVDVDRVALRPPLQRMEVKAWLSQGLNCPSRVQGIETDERPTMQIRPDPAGFSGLEQLLEAAMTEAFDHATSVRYRLTDVK